MGFRSGDCAGNTIVLNSCPSSHSLTFLQVSLGVIILLKDDIRGIETITLQAILKFILQNLKVKVPIHPTINLSSISNSIPAHTPPYHHRTSSKLNSSFHQPVTKPLSWPFPSPFASI